ncbi:MAG: hypothetical protein WBZ33_05035 [Thermoactinomyces sp.]
MMKRLRRALSQSIPTTFRLFLGLTFLIYGLAKLTIGQFGVPSDQIAAIRGEGFTIAWTFFGYSRVYEVFIGIGEVLSAILIMIPRTKTLGAVCFFPIAINVMMVNYCYQIGVQDLSTVMVMMNLFLLWLERKKFALLFWHADQIERHWPQINRKGEKQS